MSILLHKFQTINDNEIAESSLPLFISTSNNSNTTIISNKKIFAVLFINCLLLYFLFYNIIETKQFLLRSQINDDDNLYRSREYFFSH
jgi:hypothetical protein